MKNLILAGFAALSLTAAIAPMANARNVHNGSIVGPCRDHADVADRRVPGDMSACQGAPSAAALRATRHGRHATAPPFWSNA
jgi:hypothetical protein